MVQTPRHPRWGPGRQRLPVPGAASVEDVEDLLRRRPDVNLGALAELDVVTIAEIDAAAVQDIIDLVGAFYGLSPP